MSKNLERRRVTHMSTSRTAATLLATASATSHSHSILFISVDLKQFYLICQIKRININMIVFRLAGGLPGIRNVLKMMGDKNTMTQISSISLD